MGSGDSREGRQALRLELWPKQLEALRSPAQHKLYGGSAGPGKSHLARAMAITLCSAIPGMQVYLFRRNFDPLYKSHYTGRNSFHEMLAEPIQQKQISVAKLEITWNDTGSKIHGCHCQYEDDVFKYKSTEMYAVIVDEATEFTAFQLQYLSTRNRMPRSLLDGAPEWLKPMLPLTMYCTNFDDEGGSKEWLCERFGVIENWENPSSRYQPTPITLVKSPDDPNDKGKTCQYIPALIDDNPAIDKEEYVSSLRVLRHPEMVKALIDGDPTVSLGALWPELARNKHVLDEHVEPEKYLTPLYSHDWGSASPAATVWACVSDGEIKCRLDGKPHIIPRGAIYIFKHWLIAEPADTTKGLGYTNAQIAEGMYQREPRHHVDYLTDMFPFMQRGGVPMYEEYSREGITLSKADVSSKEVSAQAVRSLLVGREGVPDLYISPQCEDVYRTMKMIRPDKKKPEKPADHPEDHIPDCVMHIARAWKSVRDSQQVNNARIKRDIKRELTKKDTLLDLTDGLRVVFDGE